MGIPSDQCQESVSASDGVVLELMLEVTPLLEFMRVAGIDRTSVEASLRDVVDKVKKDPDYDPTLEDQFRDTVANAIGGQQTNAQTFVNWLELWVNKNGIPGWENATCSMNWETYACFCSSAANAFLKPDPTVGLDGPDNLKLFLSGYADGDREPCFTSVLEDTIYTDLATPPKKASILPWVGAGILAIFGVGWLATRKG